MLVVITVLRFPDLHVCLNKSKSILFVDDTTVHMSGKLINDIYKNMNNELDALADWFHANKLSLNVSKTKCMLFSRYHPVQREERVLTMSDTIIQSINPLFQHTVTIQQMTTIY